MRRSKGKEVTFINFISSRAFCHASELCSKKEKLLLEVIYTTQEK